MDKVSDRLNIILFVLLFIFLNTGIYIFLQWVSSAFDDFDNFGKQLVPSSCQKRKRNVSTNPAVGPIQKKECLPLKTDSLWINKYSPKSVV